MPLDETNVEIWRIYVLVRDQIRVAPMGEIIGLDKGIVLDVVKLYATDVKKIFEQVLICYQFEQELKSEFS